MTDRTDRRTWRGLIGMLSLVAALGLAAGCPSESQPHTPSAPDADAPDAPPAEDAGGEAGHAAVTLTDAAFDATVAEGVTLVDFWASWCPPCRRQGPIVEELAGAYAGKATVAKLDVEANPKTPEQFGVQGIPTLIVFKDGEVAERFVGLRDYETLAAALDKALAE